MKKLILIALVTILASIAAQAQARQVPDAPCKALWKYVYSRDRFSKDGAGPIPPNHVCMSFEGKIVLVHTVDENHDYDGDIDMKFELAQPFQHKRFLGVEVICAEPQKGSGHAAREARAACATFHSEGHSNPYTRTYLNDLWHQHKHLRITGYFVTDYGHKLDLDGHPDRDGHPEIHPVVNITVLH